MGICFLSFFSPLLSVSVDGMDLHVKRKGTGLLRPACGLFSPSSSMYHMLLLVQIVCLMAATVRLPLQVGRVVQSEDLCI
jgi:hypothetical protein